MTNTACPECSSAMEQGFIPDVSYGQIFQAAWHRGEPARVTLFGVVDLGVHIEKKEQLKITAWRCMRCGYLKLCAPAHHADASDV